MQPAAIALALASEPSAPAPRASKKNEKEAELPAHISLVRCLPSLARVSLSLTLTPGARPHLFPSFSARNQTRSQLAHHAAAASDFFGNPTPNPPLLQVSCPINSHDPSRPIPFETHRQNSPYRTPSPFVSRRNSWSSPDVLDAGKPTPTILFCQSQSLVVAHLCDIFSSLLHVRELLRARTPPQSTGVH